MKRNNIYTILSGALILMMTACSSLDIQPTDNLRKDQVYSNEVGISAALATLYSYLPIGTWHMSLYGGISGDSEYPFSIWNNPSVATGECEVIPLRVSGAPKTVNGGMLAWWNYGHIRFTNITIEGMLENKDRFAGNETAFNHWLGEAYFCRAFQYYAMVRSYGGVPIVKTAPSYVDLSDEELLMPRSTEKECWDFIAEDLDMAYELMGPDSYANGRVNKYIAAGLKSRAMLYAASVAKRGTVQLDGLVGIPAQYASDYYMAAYDAACKAMDNGGRYVLYNRYDDGTKAGKIKNYWHLFLDETASNTERMFIKEYCMTSATTRPENWTVQQLPYHYSMITDSGELSVTTEWIELFDDESGKPFNLSALVGTEQNPVRYNNRQDLFATAQARFLASVLVPGGEIYGFTDSDDSPAVFDVQKGIYETYPGNLHESASFEDKFSGRTIQGWCGMGSQMTNGNGCLVWKYVNPYGTANWWAGDVDWIEMRYAEILLNKAEAAINIIGETVDGKTVTMADALEPINAIRQRAGTSQLTSVTEEKIMNERRCELAFENRIFWDLKRWRKYEDVIQNKTFHALYPYYVLDEGKYIFKIGERAEIRYTYDTKSYYAPISASVIAKSNGAIKQNPGY
jgi:hypothetical protein